MREAQIGDSAGALRTWQPCKRAVWQDSGVFPFARSAPSHNKETVMLASKPNLIPQAQAKPLRHRPSTTFLNSLTKAGVEAISREIEANSVFHDLLRAGIVRKAQAAIPADRDMNYKIGQAVSFVQRHGLHAQAEWQYALDAPYIENKIAAWSEQWNVPERELRRALHFLRDRAVSLPQAGADTGAREIVAPMDTGDWEGAFAVAAAFVQQYHLTQQQFVEEVLQGELTTAGIAARFGCSLREAGDLQNVLTRLAIVDQFDADAAQAPHQAQPAGAADMAAAEAWVDREGVLQVRLLANRAGARYIVDKTEVEPWLKNGESSGEVRALLEQIEAINERAGALMAIIQAACLRQRAFLLSGDRLHLRPLSQAEIARESGYHRSIVSRLAREQWLQTPRGRYALLDLLPTRQQIVRQLTEAYPQWSDAEIATHLFQAFGVYLARRTVNYHRQQQNNGSPSQET